MVLASCGARKRVKTIQERKQFTQNDIKIDSAFGSHTSTILTDRTKEWVYEPVNTTKPIIINRDTIYNTKIVYRDRIKDSIVIQRDTVYLTKTDKTKNVKTENVKKVETEREGFNWKGLNWALFFITLIGAALLVWKLKKN
ncbi:MAG: hypothetical protein AAGF96_05845 [Bacteroidota bacterium]